MQVVRESPFSFVTLPYNVAANHQLTTAAFQLIRASLLSKCFRNKESFLIWTVENFARPKELCLSRLCSVNGFKLD